MLEITKSKPRVLETFNKSGSVCGKREVRLQIVPSSLPPETLTLISFRRMLPGLRSTGRERLALTRPGMKPGLNSA